MASTCSEQPRPGDGTVDPPPTPPSEWEGLDISLKLDGPATFDYWQHEPFHPGNNQPITFRASVKDNDGIKKIELIVLEYELYKNAEGLPSKKRRQGGKWNVVQTWDLPTPVTQREVSYRFGSGFRAKSNVEYIFRVTNTRGRRTDRLAIFDAGTSPWPKDKVLLYSTSRQPMQRTINICFFPDTDYGGDFNRFKADMSKLIYNGYMKNDMIFSHNEKWAFYYTDHQMDGFEALNKTRIGAADFPDFISSDRIEGIDAFGLVHRTDYTDLSYNKEAFNFVTNTLFTTESYNLGTAVHETAHAIFRLSDEYDRCSCFHAGDWSNVFQSMDDCKAFTRRYGLPPSNCKEVISAQNERWYTPELYPLFDTDAECKSYNRANGFPEGSCRKWLVDGREAYEAFNGTCVMRDDGDAEIRQFQDVCQALVGKYYDMLINQGTALIPTSNNTVLSERVDNLYGYQKVVSVELDIEGQKQDMYVRNIKMGVPTKNIVTQNDLHLTFQTAGERMLHEVKISSPAKILTEGGNESDVIRKNTMSKTWINIPYNENYAKAVCKDLDRIRTRARSVGAPPTAQTTNFDIQSQFQKIRAKMRN